LVVAGFAAVRVARLPIVVISIWESRGPALRRY